MSAPEWLLEHVQRSHEIARKIRAAGVPYVTISLTFGDVVVEPERRA